MKGGTVPLRPVALRLAAPVGVLLLFAIALAFAGRVIDDQRIFLQADPRVYRDLAFAHWDAIHHSFGAFLASLGPARYQPYNGLFSLPMLPVFAVFGFSPRIIMLCLVGMYLVPAALVIGLIAREMAPSHRSGVFWVTTLAALSCSVSWIPTLQMLPDVGGMLWLGLIVWLLVRDPLLESRRTLGALVLLTALCLLFRRPLVYGLLAVYCSFLCSFLGGFPGSFPGGGGRFALPRLSGGGWRALRSWLGVPLRMGLVGGGALLVLVLVAPGVAQRLAGNYGNLYAGYAMPPGEYLLNFLFKLGILPLLVAGAGYAMYLRQCPERAGRVAFLPAAGILWLGLWLVLARYPGAKHLLQVWPMVIAVGCGLGFHAIWWGHRRDRIWLRGLLVLALAAQAGAVFLPALVSTSWRAPYLLPPPVLPERGQARDYDAYLTFDRFLRQVADDGSPIYVAASSGPMNNFLLRSVDEAVRGAGETPLVFQRVPHVDSRDPLPITELLRAQIVLAALPEQYHLGADNQQIVGAVARMFVRGDGVAADFVELDRTFDFYGQDAPFTVHLFRRVRESSPHTVAGTLAAFRAAMPRWSVVQPAWVAGSSATSVAVGPGRGAVVVEPAQSGSSAPSLAVLGVDLVAAGAGIGGLAEGRPSGGGVTCGDMEMTALVSGARGEVVIGQGIVPAGDTAGFALRVPDDGGGQLMLQFAPATGDGTGCGVTLRDMVVFSP
ncbi:MAG: hypothetical protein OEW11_09910 [Nitrospirota bacterium]|nr:hypothetical protein [Nitrospirota bacterium]